MENPSTLTSREYDELFRLLNKAVEFAGYMPNARLRSSTRGAVMARFGQLVRESVILRELRMSHLVDGVDFVGFARDLLDQDRRFMPLGIDWLMQYKADVESYYDGFHLRRLAGETPDVTLGKYYFGNYIGTPPPVGACASAKQYEKYRFSKKGYEAAVDALKSGQPLNPDLSRPLDIPSAAAVERAKLNLIRREITDRVQSMS